MTTSSSGVSVEGGTVNSSPSGDVFTASLAIGHVSESQQASGAEMYLISSDHDGGGVAGDSDAGGVRGRRKVIPEAAVASSKGLSVTSFAAAVWGDVSTGPDAASSNLGLSGTSSAAEARGDVSKGLDCPRGPARDPRGTRRSIGRDYAIAGLSGTSRASPIVDYSPVAEVRPLARGDAGPALGRAVRGRTRLALPSPWFSRCQCRFVRCEAGSHG